MNIRLFAVFLSLSCSLCTQQAFAAAPSTAVTELTNLIAQVKAKLEQRKTTETDLAPELKQFDALIAKHKGEKSDDVAEIHFMRALLYLEVLGQTDKGVSLMKQLQQGFPNTGAAKNADRVIALAKQQEEANKIQASLVVGSKFPDFNVTDTAGQPLSIAKYRGKVVLLDFWATWCGPCRVELPNVIKTYETYHKKGFEIIGISLDKERDKLASFTKERNMTWPQYFDGLWWENKLAVKYGIKGIPATFLLDGQGVIIGKNLRDEALEQAVAKALDKKK